MLIEIPQSILDAVDVADMSWRPILIQGLHAVAEANPDYLPALAAEYFLPTEGRMFAAFRQPLDRVHYVLIGEGPYPREKSATGVCFMDGAVESLWSENGLSKQVNRATSLRNFMKMLLVAQGSLAIEHTSGDVMTKISSIARAPDSPYIQTLAELQDKLINKGFLLLNATPVFRSNVPPVKEARAWKPFLRVVLSALAEHAEKRGQVPATLVLWGKIAEQLHDLPATLLFPKAIAEHPYNLTFIGNAAMQALFGPMKLLDRNS